MPLYTPHSKELAGQPYSLDGTTGRFDHEGVGDTPVPETTVQAFAHYAVLRFHPIATLEEKVEKALTTVIDNVKAALTPKGKGTKPVVEPVVEPDPVAPVVPMAEPTPTTPITPVVA